MKSSARVGLPIRKYIIRRGSESLEEIKEALVPQCFLAFLPNLANRIREADEPAPLP
jgi:hypothetical protein